MYQKRREVSRVKIKISYTGEEETELQRLIELLKPIIDRFKVKKSAGTPPYKHVYFTTKNSEKRP